MKNFRIVLSFIFLLIAGSLFANTNSSNATYASSDAPEGAAVVITFDDAFVYVGFSGERSPRATFPNLVGTPKSSAMQGMGQAAAYVGEDALAKGEAVRLSRPVEKGEIRDWESFKKVLHHIYYNELRIAPEEQPVILSNSMFNKRGNRERLTQVMFEDFNVPAIYLGTNEAFALYATGKTTGLVLNLEDGMVTTTAVNEGRLIDRSRKSLYVSKSDIVRELGKMLGSKGYSFTSTADFEVLKDIYKTKSYVALDYNAEMNKPASGLEVNYELKDGQIITIGIERFRSSEILFQPSLIGSENDGIHKMINSSVTSCDKSLQSKLYSNIVISGSNSFQSTLSVRVEKELKVLAAGSTIKTTAAPERTHLTWNGASKMATKLSTDETWILKDEYDEKGPSIIHSR